MGSDGIGAAGGVMFHRERIRDPYVGMERVRLLDLEGVAEVLDVRPRFVRRHVAERRIPFVKVGRYVRFESAAIESWIDEHRVSTTRLRSPSLRGGPEPIQVGQPMTDYPPCIDVITFGL